MSDFGPARVGDGQRERRVTAAAAQSSLTPVIEETKETQRRESQTSDMRQQQHQFGVLSDKQSLPSRSGGGTMTSERSSEAAINQVNNISLASRAPEAGQGPLLSDQLSASELKRPMTAGAFQT